MLLLTSVAGFMIALDTTVVSTVLSSVRREFATSVATLEWTVNAYVLTFGVLLLTGSALGDRFGRRRLFVTGLLVFTLASAACGFAPDAGVLIAARAVQGAGAALVLPLAMTLLTAAVPAPRRGRALGVFTGAAGLATFSGPFVGGLVAQDLAWRWVFWLNLPIGLGLAGLVATTVGETYGSVRRLDLPGVALATAGLLGLVWGLVRGGAAGWGRADVVWSLAGGVVLIAAFVGWERRAPAPMLALHLFRRRAFAVANAVNVALIASMYGALFLLAQYLQTGLGFTPLGAGLRLLPWTGLLMVGAPVAGALADRFGERRFLIGGLASQALGLAWLATVARLTHSYGPMVVPLLLSGAGISTVLPAAQKAVVGTVGPGELGAVSGVFNTLRQVGGVFGIAIVTAVFAGAGGGYTSPDRFSQGFVPALGVAAGLAVIGTLIAICPQSTVPSLVDTPVSGGLDA